MSSVIEVYNKLLKFYGKQNWWPAETPFEVCVGAILTQNTSWKNVEKALENLKELKLLSPEAILKADKETLETAIRPAGFFRQKASYLKSFSDFLMEEGGFEKLKRERTQTLRKKLLSIKGIGRETADSILLYALEKPSFVVDAYTKRLFYRIGITDSESISYEYLKSLVEGQIPPLEENIEIYKEFHALIVVHCKEKCRRKPKCQECPLRKDCLYDRIKCTASP